MQVTEVSVGTRDCLLYKDRDSKLQWQFKVINPVSH